MIGTLNTSSTETYKFPSGSKGTKVDLGADNKVRYVDGTAVYQTGYTAGRNEGITIALEGDVDSEPFDILEPTDIRKSIKLGKWGNPYLDYLNTQFSSWTNLYNNTEKHIDYDDINKADSYSGTKTTYQWTVPLSTAVYTNDTGEYEFYATKWANSFIHDANIKTKTNTESENMLDANLTYKCLKDYHNSYYKASKVIIYLYGVSPNSNYDIQALEWDNVREEVTFHTKNSLGNIVPTITIYKPTNSYKIEGVSSNCDHKYDGIYRAIDSSNVYTGTVKYNTRFRVYYPVDSTDEIDIEFDCYKYIDRKHYYSSLARYDMFTVSGRTGFDNVDRYTYYKFKYNNRYNYRAAKCNDEEIYSAGRNMLQSNTIYFCPVIEFYE